MKADYEYEHKGVTVKIHQDQDRESPSSWGDDEVFLVANHRQFYVPPPGEKRVPERSDLVDHYGDSHWSFPIEAYIHSGVVLAMRNAGNFPDRQWDVSQVGAIFVHKEHWPDEDKAREAAKGLLDTWNQYLSGDVWGYVVGEDTPFEDSCWGHYGIDYCKEQANEVAESVAARLQRESDEQERCACADIVTV